MVKKALRQLVRDFHIFICLPLIWIEHQYSAGRVMDIISLRAVPRLGFPDELLDYMNYKYENLMIM